MTSLSLFYHQPSKQLWYRRFWLFVGVLCLGALAACGERYSNHGHVINDSELATVKIGQSSRTDILGTLGRPSFEGAFEKNRLYYISQRMIEPVAGTRTTKSRVIYILTFDGNDLLQSIDLKDEKSGINIAYIDEKTPTPGDTYGLIEQMFSNIGRPQASQ